MPARVVVTDLQMPGMSGLDLTAALRSTFPAVPTVIVTGHSRAGLENEAKNVGAFELLLERALYVETERRVYGIRGRDEQP